MGVGEWRTEWNWVETEMENGNFESQFFPQRSHFFEELKYLYILRLLGPFVKIVEVCYIAPQLMIGSS